MSFYQITYYVIEFWSNFAITCGRIWSQTKKDITTGSNSDERASFDYGNVPYNTQLLTEEFIGVKIHILTWNKFMVLYRT